MTNLIIEYLIYSGQLTGSMNDVRLTDEGSGIVISEWRFPQAQPAQSELDTIAASSEFQSYLANRSTILDRQQARNIFDTTQKRFALVTLDEINLLRSWIAGFKSAVASSLTLADLKIRVSNLPNMPERTAAQLKNAMDSKD